LLDDYEHLILVMIIFKVTYMCGYDLFKVEIKLNHI